MVEKEKVDVTQKLQELREEKPRHRGVPSLRKLFEKLDKTDFIILRKFYMAGPEPLSKHLQTTLKNELESSGVKLSTRAVGMRLENLVKLGLLEKTEYVPKIYRPKEELQGFVKKMILTYAALVGRE